MRKIQVKVRQNVLEDADDELTYWLIKHTHARHVDPEVWGYLWDEWSVGDMSGWGIRWTRRLPEMRYALLDVETAADHEPLPRCVLAVEAFNPVAELWIPDERELLEDPLFRASV